jgi:agmatine deiminase
MTKPTTPAQLGYRMPAEWDPHAATWLSWPRRAKTWQDRFEAMPAVWAKLARTLAEFEPVHILVGGDAMPQAQSLLGGVANVALHDISTNDGWMRDHGPTFLVGRSSVDPPALVEWVYNAWGGKYPPYDDDRQVARRVAELTGRQRFSPGIVLEGGSIDVNGEGTVLTTEACLLNPNRNPHLSRREIEGYLADYCAAPQVLWLSHGLVGDDTDGHIDQLARFVDPTTVVAAFEDDSHDDNYASLAANFERLKSMTDQSGRPLEIIPLPMPDPVIHNGNRLPASYANFYIANGVVIVPSFDDPADAVAADLLGQLFPDREIRPLPACDLVIGRGAYHCVTQQEPL